MNPVEYERMFELEDRHWWFAGKRRLVRAILDRVELPRDAAVLDVGCGTGGMFAVTKALGRVTAVDASPLAIGFARRRGGVALARAALPDLPFADATFDLVTAFDVLYHQRVGDDRAAIAEIRRVLRPGGAFLVVDSALPSLRAAHDEAMHGARRYTVPELRAKLVDAGLAVERATYTNCLLFPVAAAWRLATRRARPGGDSDVRPASALGNALAGALYALEAQMLRIGNLPIGTSLAAVARRA